MALDAEEKLKKKANSLETKIVAAEGKLRDTQKKAETFAPEVEMMLQHLLQKGDMVKGEVEGKIPNYFNTERKLFEASANTTLQAGIRKTEKRKHQLIGKAERATSKAEMAMEKPIGLVKRAFGEILGKQHKLEQDIEVLRTEQSDMGTLVKDASMKRFETDRMLNARLHARDKQFRDKIRDTKQKIRGELGAYVASGLHAKDMSLTKMKEIEGAVKKTFREKLNEAFASIRQESNEIQQDFNELTHLGKQVTGPLATKLEEVKNNLNLISEPGGYVEKIESSLSQYMNEIGDEIAQVPEAGMEAIGAARQQISRSLGGLDVTVTKINNKLKRDVQKE